MARVYGYMDDETGVFTPVGGGQSGSAYGGNGYAPRRVGYGTESMYSSAPASYPLRQNLYYGPGAPVAQQWYGSDPNTSTVYAGRGYTPPPGRSVYNPYANTVYAGRGVPSLGRSVYNPYMNQNMSARTPVYSAYPGSGAPVRAGVDPNGRPYQSTNVSFQQPRQQVQSQARRSTPRVRANPQPVPLVPSGNVQVPENMQLYHSRSSQAVPVPRPVSVAPEYEGWDWGVAYQPGSYTPLPPRMSSVPQSEWDDAHQGFARAAAMGEWQRDIARKVWDTVKGWLTSGEYTEEEMREKMKAIDGAVGLPVENATETANKTS